MRSTIGHVRLQVKIHQSYLTFKSKQFVIGNLGPERLYIFKLTKVSKVTKVNSLWAIPNATHGYMFKFTNVTNVKKVNSLWGVP